MTAVRITGLASRRLFDSQLPYSSSQPSVNLLPGTPTLSPMSVGTRDIFGTQAQHPYM